MASLNKVLLMGNVTKDPVLKYTPAGVPVCDLGLAVNRKWNDSKTGEQKEEVVFVDCELWGKSAETTNQYIRKGRLVFVEGRLRFDQWQDKATGAQRSRLKVVGERVQFLGAPPAAESQAQNPPPATPPAVQAPPRPPKAPPRPVTPAPREPADTPPEITESEVPY